MARSKNVTVGWIAAALALAAPAAAHEIGEQTPGPGWDSNVLVTITVGESGDPGEPVERTYRIVARQGSRSRLNTGWRLPIPTTTTQTTSAKGGKTMAVPTTSFTYQNVGLTVDLKAKAAEARLILLEGSIDFSAVDPDPNVRRDRAAAPTIGTFEQRFDTVLREGIPSRIGEVPDPRGGSLYIEVQADLLD